VKRSVFEVHAARGKAGEAAVATMPFLFRGGRAFFYTFEVNAMNSKTIALDRRKGKLLLADGTRFDGYLTGADGLPVWGEVVFNTSMTGYQEVITDPSYAGQIVVMTYPQIGNYGVTVEDNERSTVAARALVVRELSPFFSPAPNRCSLESFMFDQELPGLTGVDTRAITKHIRSRGAVIGVIGAEAHEDADLLRLAGRRSFSHGESLVEGVSGSLNGAMVGTGDARAAVIDLGVKRSILDRVLALGATVEVFDAGFRASEILGGGFDFVVLSNGPGDPTDNPDVIEETKRLLGNVPMLGICLGHQIIALALGGRTYKLKFGHHGANQPVVDRRTDRVFITSQNHGYAVADDISMCSRISITYFNANDNTLEGFAADDLMLECVQFHPEASPGPHDTSFIFESFYEKAKGWRNASNSNGSDTTLKVASDA
jgi:carbamoyl-phosphate synthase small subunit